MAGYDEIYGDGTRHYVMCGDSIDDKFAMTTGALEAGMTRAANVRHPLHLYAHAPSVTVSLSRVEAVLESAERHGLQLVTYDEVARARLPGSVALSFDDHNIAAWTTLRPLLARYDAHVTFFVSEFENLSDDERAQLRQLADDGHDIEYHSTHHLNAVQYTAEHGIEAYVADEIVPGLTAMRQAGYRTQIFAYPFGARSTETDDALRPYFTHLRAIRTTCPR